MAPITTAPAAIADALELAGLLRPAWDEISAGIARTGAPTCEGDDGEAADDQEQKDEEQDQEQDGEEQEEGEPDWKQHSRKHERAAKSARKEAEELRRKLKEREDADLSEHEKAIQQARDEAKAEAESAVAEERRRDRLEVAVTRAAAKTFADPEDALVHLERAIGRGEVDPEDIFSSEGTVQTDSLKSALDELLERKPHLAATQGESGRRNGSSDAGKGKRASADDLDVEGHLEQIRRHK